MANEREQRGMAIAALCRITKQGDKYLVPSQSGGPTYKVDLNGETPTCTCPDHETRQCRCKHIYAVQFTVKREEQADGSIIETRTVTISETRPVRKTYAQNWPAYNRAATTEKSVFQVLLHDLCRTVKEPAPVARRPGPKPYTLADAIFSATFKVYSTFSGRRFMVDLQDAHARGYTSEVIHYNSIFRTLQNKALTPILRDLVARSATPLKSVESGFAVDSSGFSTSTFARWFDAKYGTERRVRTWIKCHLMCGVRTHIVTSVEIDQSNQSDYNQFDPLVTMTAQTFNIGEVAADKAYLGNSNLDLVNSLGATLYAPFKINSTAGEPGTVWNKMWAFWEFNRDYFLQRYHTRSNVESVFSMMKRKHGNAIRSKTPTAQVNEVLCKVLTHNICVLCQEIQELGIAAKFGAESEDASSSGPMEAI